MKVNNLIVAFFAEDPPCSSQTCPEMRASEWQYLCAVHDPPKSCCAIDYCCHTLDWATNILTSPKFFPSRLALGSAAHGGPQASMRHLTNIFRRLYRIFAHAWFQHRDIFWEVEGNDGLYILFKTVCDMYNLIPEDNYTVPPEAEGQDAQQPVEQETKDGRRLTILRKDDEISGHLLFDDMNAPGATTRRHKHSPSTGSRVTTIAESSEDIEENQKQSLPEKREGSGQKKTEQQPAVETVGEHETTSEQPPDASIEAQQTAELEEEKVPEASESQASEPQPVEQEAEAEKSEPQQPEPQTSDSKTSEPPASEDKPSEPEEPAAEEEKQTEQPVEGQEEPTTPEESSEETQAGQQETDVEMTATEEDTSAKPSGIAPETEPKTEADATKES